MIIWGRIIELLASREVNDSTRALKNGAVQVASSGSGPMYPWVVYSIGCWGDGERVFQRELAGEEPLELGTGPVDDSSER